MLALLLWVGRTLLGDFGLCCWASLMFTLFCLDGQMLLESLFEEMNCVSGLSGIRIFLLHNSRRLYL
jgi:hypothetical protein